MFLECASLLPGYACSSLTKHTDFKIRTLTMRSKKLFFLLSTLPLLSASIAAEVSYDQSIDCHRVDKEGGSGYEIGQCAGRARVDANTQMGKVYAQLRKTQNKTDDALLIKSQRAWNLWREREAAFCAANAGFSPKGSGYGIQWAYCDAGIVENRTKKLRQYLQDN